MDIDTAERLALATHDAERRDLLFFSKVRVQPDGCWIWTAYVNRTGYGVFGTGKGKTPMLAHRWAWRRLVGPLTEQDTLDHLCRVTRCVNPRHLEPVTSAENTRRAAAHRRPLPYGEPIDGIPHGIYSSYAKRGCRCRPCRTVGTEYRRRARARARARAL